MKRLFIPLAILLTVIFVITGCGTSSPTPTPAATAPAATSPATIASAIPTSVPSAPAPASTTTKPSVTNAPSVTPTGTGTQLYGGTLRLIQPASPETPIGWLPESGTDAMGVMQISAQTLLKEEINGSLVPNLAESYDVNTDPKDPSITLHLRKGVKFADGSDFNAQAVKWNLDNIKANSIQFGGVVLYWKSIEVLDDYTVRVHFTLWQNRVVRTFGDTVTYMVSPTAYQKNGVDWMKSHIVGTGAFNQTNFQQDVTFAASRNPNYWEPGKPYLDGVQELYVADELTREALFKSGGGDILNTNGNGRVASEMQAAGYKIITQLGGAVTLFPDSANADSPWSNLKVRQAAEYALDKQSMAKTFGFGYWQAAYQNNSPDSTAYDAGLVSQYRTYDVARAKQLLTDAGYPNGFKTTIIAGPVGLNTDLIVAIQSNLAKVGIQCDLQFPQSAEWSQISTSPWHNALLFEGLLQWANPNVAFNFFFGTVSPFAKSLKRPDGWGDMVTASLATASPDPTFMKKLEDAAFNDDMVIPLYFGAAMYATTDKVHDTGFGTRGASFWWEPQQAWLSK